jgi:high-affinity K+ transport system ATPase subunit B
MQTRLNSKGTVMCADGKLVAMIGADANDAPALAAPGRNGATNNKSGKGGG